MTNATSCGGVVIFRGKILLLYKNYRNKYEGWVLPKGTVEEGESYNETALREVKEESGATAQIMKYVGKTTYSSKPQREEYFCDSGYYKYHEAYHLLKFPNEKQILEQAYSEYLSLRNANLWGSKKYY